MAINNLYHSHDPYLRRRWRWRPGRAMVAAGFLGWLGVMYWIGTAWGM